MPYKPDRRPEWIKNVNYGMARAVSKMITYATFRMHVRGLENVPANGPALLLSNHQSFLDPVLVGVPISRRIHFVARDSLYSNALMQALMRICLTIPIKRGSADLTAIKEILRALKEGHVVGLFPEATRTKDGTIQPIKPGFGLLVKKSKAPIIPAALEGAYECWPRHRKIFTPGEIAVKYGKPISAETVTSLDDKAFADLVTDRLRTLQNQCRTQMLKRPPFDYQHINIEKEPANEQNQIING